MLQPLPTGGSKWVDTKGTIEELLERYPSDEDKVLILEVELEENSMIYTMTTH